MFKGLIVIAALTLTGCSALSSIGDILPAKDGVDATAQIGASNTKQGVGVSASNDSSAETGNTIKESKVGKVDSSSKKTEVLNAGVINADKLEINQSGIEGSAIMMIIMSILLAVSLSFTLYKSKKGQ
jgi:hypothetical protein